VAEDKLKPNLGSKDKTNKNYFFDINEEVGKLKIKNICTTPLVIKKKGNINLRKTNYTNISIL
jgi:hypothetical protein